MFLFPLSSICHHYITMTREKGKLKGGQNGMACMNILCAKDTAEGEDFCSVRCETIAFSEDYDKQRQEFFQVEDWLYETDVITEVIAETRGE